MDEPRRSNWEDALSCDLPPCTFCGAVNRPGVVYLEIVNGELVCRVCGKSEKRPV